VRSRIFMPSLCVARGLGVTYASLKGEVRALSGVDLTVERATICGVIGASGSGKTTLGLALAGLLPEDARLEGELTLAGHPITRREDFDPLRGRVVTYIPQEPGLALNPVLRAVTQVRDAARCALGLGRAEADDRARKALAEAGLASKALQEAYPHELSGGQRQRVLLARAFLLCSQLVVADEPTSALDAVTQRGILRLFWELKTAGSAVLFITHTPKLLPGFALQAVWMAEGRVMAAGDTEMVLARGAAR
jgi:ABC-type glutathione transport system ATPase component